MVETTTTPVESPDLWRWSSSLCRKPLSLPQLNVVSLDLCRKRSPLPQLNAVSNTFVVGVQIYVKNSDGAVVGVGLDGPKKREISGE
ncbi:unnamed protein product [Lactuca virosa]|uniref:Uncharacterized protein n=1 Tax=Lactuca virosa TaxID=75947 RepID=A0AAU9LXY6_9ASTR|nr:unnamed protein product [Lactuca virosa]